MEVCKRDALAKERMKQHSDDRKRAKESNLKIGDTVLVQQPKRDKFTTKYNPKPYTIPRKKGTLIEAERHDHRITRNASFFKKLSLQDKGSYDYDDNYDYDDYGDDLANKNFELNVQRYPIRNRRPVYRYGQNIYDC